jgi:hypothetical protein
MTSLAEAGVQHASDVGMIERCQDVLLAGEAVCKERASRVQRQDL